MQPHWKAVWRFLKKLGMEPPFDPVIPLFSIYPKELKSTYYSDSAASMFIAAQFTIAKLWNQPSCPSKGEWIKKMWYIYTIEYYSAIKKNKIMTFVSIHFFRIHFRLSCNTLLDINIHFRRTNMLKF